MMTMTDGVARSSRERMRRLVSAGGQKHRERMRQMVSAGGRKHREGKSERCDDCERDQLKRSQRTRRTFLLGRLAFFLVFRQDFVFLRRWRSLKTD